MSSKPYWEDENWDSTLFKTVQAAVRYPADLPDQSIQSAHAKVEFTFVDGRITDPEIAESTGYPDLDAAMLRQVASASVPKAFGPHATEPHSFAMQLEVPTPFEAFSYAEATAIDARKFYPKQALLEGAEGSVVVSFTYLDGKVSDVAIATSSKDKSLDNAAIQAISNARFPPPPPGYASKPLHMKVLLCYSLGSSNICPETKRIVQVVNTPGADQPASPPSGP